MKKILTLCMVYNNTHILLGMKKRGFGQARWNGFGGKLHPNESIEQAAIRELKEEAGIMPLGTTKRGILNFEFENDPQILETHVFSVSGFFGTPQETEEMNPRWFEFSQIPFKEMWPDDKYWIPFLLQGKNFWARFYFKNINEVLRHEVKEIFSFNNIPVIT